MLHCPPSFGTVADRPSSVPLRFPGELSPMAHAPTTHPAIVIRPATASDTPAILAMIRELAEFEKLLDQVAATEEGLRQWLFGASRVAEALLACGADGTPVGYAIFFPSFSTFLGRPGLYLEDLYVRPASRGQGIGRALLVHLARIATARGCGRLEWSVLDWNEKAIRFYKGLGAQPMNQWTVFRVTGEALRRLDAAPCAAARRLPPASGRGRHDGQEQPVPREDVVGQQPEA